MNPEAIEKLIDTHGNAIYNFCVYLSQSKQDAEDLYQETFLKAVEQPEKIDEENNPKSYLLSVAVYIHKSRKRKFARRQQIAPSVSFEEAFEMQDQYDLENDIIKKDMQSEIRNLVSELDEQLKLPLYLYYTMDASIEEISKIMKLPKGTVKSRLFKARKLIKKKLEVVGYEESSVV